MNATEQNREGLFRFIVQRASVIPSSAVIYVPKVFSNLDLYELPISKRLRGLSEKLGIRYLGGFNEASAQELKKVKNCGRKTINELFTLIKVLSTGQVAVDIDQHELSLGHIITGLDSAIDLLTPRSRHILLGFLGGFNATPLSFRELAQKHGVTRQRIQAIYYSVLENLPRLGGPSVIRGLQRLVQDCELRVFPVTPNLIEEEAKVHRSSIRYSWQFYAELVKAMSGLSEAANPSIRKFNFSPGRALVLNNRVVEILKELPREESRTCRETFAILLQSDLFHNLCVWEFFSAIFRSKQLSVSLSHLRNPTIQLKRISYSRRQNISEPSSVIVNV
jgi:hypothetical protein